VTNSNSKPKSYILTKTNVKHQISRKGCKMIEMILSGFLFLFILVLNVAMGAVGYLMEKDDYDPDADLKKINNNPKKFKIGIGLAL
jgi:hypothetical protein